MIDAKFYLIMPDTYQVRYPIKSAYANFKRKTNNSHELALLGIGFLKSTYIYQILLKHTIEIIHLLFESHETSLFWVNSYPQNGRFS